MVSHHIKKHVGLVPGLQENCSDISYDVLTAGLVVMVYQCVCWVDFLVALWLWVHRKNFKVGM